MSGLYKIGVGCVVQNVGLQVFWEEGAKGGQGGSWARVYDLRMCVVRGARLRVEGAAGRRGAGTGSECKIRMWACRVFWEEGAKGGLGGG